MSSDELFFSADDVTGEEILRNYADKAVSDGKQPPRHPHPGLVLYALFESYEIHDMELVARWLGYSRHDLFSEVISGRAPISKFLAGCLAEKFVPEAEFWLAMQKEFDHYHPGRMTLESEGLLSDSKTSEPMEDQTED